jgi:exopolysaccharide biosynthesis polyprenyl glycosylphosphotransferase
VRILHPGGVLRGAGQVNDEGQGDPAVEGITPQKRVVLPFSERRAYLLLIDLLLVFGVFMLADRFFLHHRLGSFFNLVFLVTWPSALLLFGGYHLANMDRESTSVAILLESILGASVFLLVVRGPFQAGFTSTQLLLTCFATGILLLLHRFTYASVFGRSPAVENVLFLGGCDKEILEIYKKKFEEVGFPVRFLGVEVVDHLHPEAFLRRIAEGKVHTIIACHEMTLDRDEIGLLEGIEMKGVRVINMEDFYESSLQRIPIFLVGGQWRYNWSAWFSENPTYHNLKILTNWALGLPLALLCTPLLFVSCLAIVLEDGWPPLFRQRRVGKNGRVFTLIKLRTMKRDAEAAGEAVWAGVDDPRVTRVGKVLRRFRIDELPQLWNVLSGAMNLVGPRPERPQFVDDLEERIPFYSRRHVVKPGITGWAQVRYHYGASPRDSLVKLKYDLWYIKNRSLMLDLQILIETVFVVLGRRGAR